jgi:hypothetical protein
MTLVWAPRSGATMRSMTSLPAEIDDHDDKPDRNAQARERQTRKGRARPEQLVLVRPSAPTVVRTFADGEETVRTWSRLRRIEYRLPAGQVHAAHLEGDATLCGTPLSSLQEFGRSRYPFERIAQDERCRTCDDAAGRPHG